MIFLLSPTKVYAINIQTKIWGALRSSLPFPPWQSHHDQKLTLNKQGAGEKSDLSDAQCQTETEKSSVEVCIANSQIKVLLSQKNKLKL